MPLRPHPPPALAAALLIGASLLTACGAPPDPRPGGQVPSPSAISTTDAAVTSLPPPPADPAPPVDAAPSAPPPRTPSPPAAGRPSAPPTATPRPTGTPARTSAAVPPPPGCGGEPSATEVVRLLRAEELLPERASVTVGTGPLCADGWQYTVVRVPGRDPLQVVTAGDPGGLRLVAAGTEVCTPQVAAEAPAAVAAVAGCVG